MSSLAQMKCVPCRGDAPTVTEEELAELKSDVPKWDVVEQDGVKKLKREFDFPNFKKALSFTTQIGQIAESEDHHPVLVTEWGKATVTWWTHAIGGLHRNDFIMAAKTDQAYQSRS